jgi:hypothetical protein
MIKIASAIKEILFDPDSVTGTVLYWSILVYLGMLAFFPNTLHLGINDLLIRSGQVPYNP